MMAAFDSPREFAVAQPPRDPRVVMVPLVLLPMIIGFGVFFVVASKGPAPLPHGAMVLGGAIFAVAFAAVFVMLIRAVQRRNIVLVGGELDVTATLYRRKLPVAAFDLGKALIVNLDDHQEWRPLVKTNGLGLPGLQAGWFRTRGLVKTFCLLTARHRVLVLPELTGGATLLSAERPQQLLDAMCETADASRHAS
jgi:hypothetical protein